MSAPNDAQVFGNEIKILASEDGALSLSNKLTDLFVQAREKYAWPRSATAEDSQKKIIVLEQQVQIWIANLSGENASLIMHEVSAWGGNKIEAITAIGGMTQAQRQESAAYIGELLTPSAAKRALWNLTSLPGIDLVMATKIYRFCAPRVGAAIDRHSSYFFNSLCDLRVPTAPRASTQFRREHAGRNPATRLATYYRSAREFNLQEYFSSYLPLVTAIADSLNRAVGGFRCAVAKERTPWRPADVEMAAYQWWSRNGPS